MLMISSITELIWAISLPRVTGERFSVLILIGRSVNMDSRFDDSCSSVDTSKFLMAGKVTECGIKAWANADSVFLVSKLDSASMS